MSKNIKVNVYAYVVNFFDMPQYYIQMYLLYIISIGKNIFYKNSLLL